MWHCDEGVECGAFLGTRYLALQNGLVLQEPWHNAPRSACCWLKDTALKAVGTGWCVRPRAVRPIAAPHTRCVTYRRRDDDDGRPVPHRIKRQTIHISAWVWEIHWRGKATPDQEAAAFQTQGWQVLTELFCSYCSHKLLSFFDISMFSSVSREFFWLFSFMVPVMSLSVVWNLAETSRRFSSSSRILATLSSWQASMRY